MQLLGLNPLSTGKSVQTKHAAVAQSVQLRLNPLSTGKSVQTLPLFFSSVKQRLIEAKYFKVCISKVSV